MINHNSASPYIDIGKLEGEDDSLSGYHCLDDRFTFFQGELGVKVGPAPLLGMLVMVAMPGSKAKKKDFYRKLEVVDRT